MKTIIEFTRADVTDFCIRNNLPIPNNPNSLRKILLEECVTVRFPYFKKEDSL